MAMILVSKESRRVSLARKMSYLVKASACLLSYSIVDYAEVYLYFLKVMHKFIIHVTSIYVIHCAIFQADVCTSSRQRVDC